MSVSAWLSLCLYFSLHIHIFFNLCLLSQEAYAHDRNNKNYPEVSGFSYYHNWIYLKKNKAEESVFAFVWHQQNSVPRWSAFTWWLDGMQDWRSCTCRWDKPCTCTLAVAGVDILGWDRKDVESWKLMSKAKDLLEWTRVIWPHRAVENWQYFN